MGQSQKTKDKYKNLNERKRGEKKQKGKAGIRMRNEQYVQDCRTDQDQKHRDGLSNETQVSTPNRQEKDKDRKCRKVLLT